MSVTTLWRRGVATTGAMAHMLCVLRREGVIMIADPEFRLCQVVIHGIKTKKQDCKPRADCSARAKANEGVDAVHGGTEALAAARRPGLASPCRRAGLAGPQHPGQGPGGSDSAEGLIRATDVARCGRRWFGALSRRQSSSAPSLRAAHSSARPFGCVWVVLVVGNRVLCCL